MYRKNEILYYNIHLKKLFDVLYQFSLRKHSAKAVSSGFFFRFINARDIKPHSSACVIMSDSIVDAYV